MSRSVDSDSVSVFLRPQVGDKVEVAWKGKFRLESLEVYNGTAWWVARVVDKGKRPGHYKVRETLPAPLFVYTNPSVHTVDE